MKEVYLEHLSLYNFKNYEEASLDFRSPVICFVGNNGSGKTNLLDAIYYLSTTRSFFNPVDSQNILHGQDQMAVTGEFLRDGHPEQVICNVRRNQRKIVKRNFKEYEKLADHIGVYPAVIITPYDIELIWEGSEVRRKFLDTTLSQLSRPYLDALMMYNHALLQRNNLLKNFAKQGNYSQEMLDPWDYVLSEKGDFIHQERKTFLEKFIPVFENVYSEICGGSEEAGIVFESDLNEYRMSDLLMKNSDKDRMLERTSSGIHRDDLNFTISSYSLKKFASQGQQKSFLFALKLAQYVFISEVSGMRPMLMLDDLFDKMDESRMNHILHWISSHNPGQVFITDTHPERIPEILAARGLKHEIWEVSQGKVVKCRVDHSNQNIVA